MQELWHPQFVQTNKNINALTMDGANLKYWIDGWMDGTNIKYWMDGARKFKISDGWMEQI